MAVPWATLGLVATGLLIALLPGGAEAVQYNRAAVGEGEVWRLLTGQLAHWTVRMAALDLGILFLLGCALEHVMPARTRLALLLGAAASAFAIQALPPGYLLYRGASGIATSLYVLGTVSLWRVAPH